MGTVKVTDYQEVKSLTGYKPEGSMPWNDFKASVVRKLTPHWSLRMLVALGFADRDRTVNSALLVIDDQIEAHDLLYSYSYKNIGFSAEALYSILDSGTVLPYVFAGPGINVSTREKSAFIQDASIYNGAGLDVGDEKSMGTTCLDFSCGAGLRIAMSRNTFIFGQYRFTYWNPVEQSWIESVDNFTYSKWENHLVHSGEAGIGIRF